MGNVSGPALDFGGLKYYTTPGQQADLPTLIATNHMDNRHIAHEIYTDNGSFFRVKNISMSYEFPTALVNKIKLQRLRVYGYMDNVWVFSKSKTYPRPGKYQYQWLCQWFGISSSSQVYFGCRDNLLIRKI